MVEKKNKKITALYGDLSGQKDGEEVKDSLIL